MLSLKNAFTDVDDPYFHYYRDVCGGGRMIIGSLSKFLLHLFRKDTGNVLLEGDTKKWLGELASDVIDTNSDLVLLPLEAELRADGKKNAAPMIPRASIIDFIDGATTNLSINADDKTKHIVVMVVLRPPPPPELVTTTDEDERLQFDMPLLSGESTYEPNHRLWLRTPQYIYSDLVTSLLTLVALPLARLFAPTGSRKEDGGGGGGKWHFEISSDTSVSSHAVAVFPLDTFNIAEGFKGRHYFTPLEARYQLGAHSPASQSLIRLLLHVFDLWLDAGGNQLSNMLSLTNRLEPSFASAYPDILISRLAHHLVNVSIPLDLTASRPTSRMALTEWIHLEKPNDILSFWSDDGLDDAQKAKMETSLQRLHLLGDVLIQTALDSTT